MPFERPNPYARLSDKRYGGVPREAPASAAAPQVAPPPPAPAAPPPPVPQGPRLAGPGAPGQQPTKFTNFNRYFNANKDVAQREAGKYAQQATNLGLGAQQALEDAKYQFQTNLGAAAVPEVPNFRLPLAQQPRDQWGVTIPIPSADEMEAVANRAYTGPGGLGDVKGIQGVYNQTLDAQQGINALTEKGGLEALVAKQGGGGTSGFSAGLIGGAGRRQFDALRARFNPQLDIGKAQKEAGTAAEKAKAAALANQKKWGEAVGPKRAEEARYKAALDAKAAQAADRAAKDKARADATAALPEDSLVDRSTPDSDRGWYGRDLGSWGSLDKREKDSYAKEWASKAGMSEAEVTEMLNLMPKEDYYRLVGSYRHLDSDKAAAAIGAYLANQKANSYVNSTSQEQTSTPTRPH